MPNRAELQLARAIRNEEIVKAVTEGQQYSEIGRTYGITPQRVHQIWKRELQRRPVPYIDEHRRKEAALIDHAMTKLFEIINDSSAYRKDRVDALRVLATYSEARRRLLGLDAPQRREITVLTEDVVDAALRKASEEFETVSRQLEAATREAELRGEI